MYIGYANIFNYIVTIEFEFSKFDDNIVNQNKIFSIKEYKIIEIEDFNGKPYKKIKKFNKYKKNICVAQNKDVIKFRDFYVNFPTEYKQYTGNVIEYFDDGNINKEYYLCNGEINGIYKKYDEFDKRLLEESNFINNKRHGICKINSPYYMIDAIYNYDNLIEYKINITHYNYKELLKYYEDYELQILAKAFNKVP